MDESQKKKKNKTKSKVRAMVEHLFRILKRVFSFKKVRDRGITENHNQPCAELPQTKPHPFAVRLCGRMGHPERNANKEQVTAGSCGMTTNLG